MTPRFQITAVAALLFAGTAAVPTASAAGVVHGTELPGTIEGSYLVLTDAPANEITKAAVLRAGGEPRREFHHAISGFEAKMTPQLASRVAALRGVRTVEQNRVVRSAEVQVAPPSWGLDRVDQRSLPLDGSFTASSSGSRVSTYVIDSGVRISHVEFEGRASYGVDLVDNDSAADDCLGHGTHVAGTVGGRTSGIAKSAAIVAVRVLDCRGDGTVEGVVAGIDWVTANAVKPAVATLSLGGDASEVIDDAVRRSVASGITYSVAANNSNEDACLTSPARVGEAITVGASTQADKRAAFSNFGRCVDLFAPGEQIVSAGIASDTATTKASGTSMAAPHVAGAAALVLSESPALTPAEVREKLISDATPGLLADVGAGSPNLLLHVR